LEKIFYSYPSLASFVEKDLHIFSKAGKVTCFSFWVNAKWKTPLVFLHQLFSILWHLPSTTLYITQFAGYQSVLPTLFARLTGKKNILVLGGTDCNWLPSIAYGNFNKRWLRNATVYSLKKADLLLPVSKDLVYTSYSYFQPDGPCQGYACFYPNIHTPYIVVPNGIDLCSFPFSSNQISNYHPPKICYPLQVLVRWSPCIGYYFMHPSKHQTCPLPWPVFPLYPCSPRCLTLFYVDSAHSYQKSCSAFA